MKERFPGRVENPETQSVRGTVSHGPVRDLPALSPWILSDSPPENENLPPSVSHPGDPASRAETTDWDFRDPTILNPCFLGSSGENGEVFERLLVDLVRDHLYWRRNFHPEDPPPIPMLAAHEPSYVAFMDRLRTELNTLTAALKRSVPFFNPRYLGHMVSDTLLPGLLAQMVTTLYNPNNVSPEAAPVTLALELEVGRQLARMLGWETDPGKTPCAWGHLTSGGTLANFESLVNLRAIRCFPLALRAALLAVPGAPEFTLSDGRLLVELDDWTLFNLPLDEVMSLPARLRIPPADPAALRVWHDLHVVLADLRIENTGLVDFARHHPLCSTIQILLPRTAHYSWHKAARALGFGTSQLDFLPVDRKMRLSPPGLEARLENACRNQKPVLAVVAMLGTTEFGTIDPLHDIVELRRRFRTRGLEFGLHVDAAWGGYLTSIFRDPDGGFLPHDQVRRGFAHFPSDSVYQSFQALVHADSITVDPHKLGYLPYGIGGIVWRHRGVRDFLGERAPYVFDPNPSGSTVEPLGPYILEGSKPGAQAAAAWVTHRVLPLDCLHLGRLQRFTILAGEYFYDHLPALTERLRGEARVLVPLEPDTNLLCLAINPEGNTSLSAANRFCESLYSHLRIDPTRPVQLRDFFSSHTRVSAELLGPENWSRTLDALGIDPAEVGQGECTDLFLLRHTLMNPWLLDSREGKNPIDRYLKYLEELIRSELDRGSWRPPCAPLDRRPTS